MSSEFVKQTLRDTLTRTIVPPIADGFWSIYDNAKTMCERNKQPEKTLQTFQNLLTRIPQWNQETLQTEVDRISQVSKCDYLDDLLLGVFVSYIRAFASLQQTDASHVKVDFERPPVTKFVHAFYTQSARKCWTAAYLFKTIGVSSEQQARNRRDIEKMLEETVNEVIDGFIPWREISKAYFQQREAAPPVKFEETPAVREFEIEEEEEEEEEERPRLTVGEDIKLDDKELEEDDTASVDTEDEISAKLKTSDTVSLNV